MTFVRAITYLGRHSICSSGDLLSRHVLIHLLSSVSGTLKNTLNHLRNCATLKVRQCRTLLWLSH